MIYFLRVAFSFLLTVWFELEFVEAIVGGQYARINQFKYQLSLQYNGKHKCGAAIIDEKYALTAAHCVLNENDKFNSEYQYMVRGGVVDFEDEYPIGIEVPVQTIYVPKEYKSSSVKKNIVKSRSMGDIAVLKLEQGLLLNNNQVLSKLNLPMVDNYEMQKSIIAGYGVDKVIIHEGRNGRKIEEIWEAGRPKLKFIQTTVLTYEECRQKYQNVLLDSHFCAQSENNDFLPAGVCAGDSGSPLVLHGDVVIGILVSGSARCDERRKPAIYTCVYSFLSFIQKAISGKELDDIRVATYKKKKVLLGLLGKKIELTEIRSTLID